MIIRRVASAGVIGSSLLIAAFGGVSHRAPADPPRLTGTIDLTIGNADEGREAYLFSDIRGLTLDSRQRIIVSDNTTHNVRVYSATGTHLFTFGRKGQGPGDLVEPCCITIAPDGKLWVKEFGNHRYSSFTLGTDRATFNYSVRSGANPSGLGDRVAWDPQGHIVDVTSGFASGSGFLRGFLDSTGLNVGRDTLRDPPKDSLSNFVLEKCTSNGCGSSTFGQPYGATSLRAFGPNGETALAVSSRYAVLWQDAHGKRIALLQQPVAGPPLSSREKGIAGNTMDAIAKNIGKARSSLPFDVPARKAPVRAIGFDLDGRLWIERAVVDGTPRRADVYDRRGQWTAIMEWPRDVDLGLWAVRGTTGVGVGTDSLGTHSIVRLRFR